MYIYKYTNIIQTCKTYTNITQTYKTLYKHTKIYKHKAIKILFCICFVLKLQKLAVLKSAHSLWEWGFKDICINIFIQKKMWHPTATNFCCIELDKCTSGLKMEFHQLQQNLFPDMFWKEQYVLTLTMNCL